MKRALVAIGVDKTGGLPTLQAAADGASKIATWAKSQGFDTVLLTDKAGPVTLSKIADSIFEVVNKKIYDQLVIYFSGHGLLKGSNYEIWLLSGAPVNPNEAVNVTGSIDLSRNCGISHVVFISDACRSMPVTLGMNYVLGGVIFPAQQPRPPSPEIDTFYATIPGNPALEVPPDEAATNYRGIFTDCLLQALLGKVDGVVREIAEPIGTKHVIPSRPLKNYLLDAVPDAATAVSITLHQDPEIRVESDLPKYLGEVAVTTSASSLESFPSLRFPSNSDALELLKQSHFLGPQSRRHSLDLISESQSLGKDKASRIVRDCIRFTGKFDGEIKAQNKLESVGINSEYLVDILKNQLSNSRERGLPSAGHTINANALDITTNTKVFSLRDQVLVNVISLWKEEGSVQVMEKEIQELLDTKGRLSFETRTGFTVHGAKVVSANTTGTLCDVFEESGLSQVRVHIDPTNLKGFAYESRSTVMRFDTGSGACLATLPGYVGTVVVGEEGRILAVNYTPARGTERYAEYEMVADDLERRRAFAAVAARNGALTLDRKEAVDAARYLRMLKAVDPTLGIYAAYAYAQAGDQEGVKSVYRYMEEPSFGYHYPVPFDVAMLAHRNGPWPEAYRFPPTMPMLTQGWALLGGLEHSMHPAALNARHYLIPSLWTAFSAEGINILEAAIILGEFRWI